MNLEGNINNSKDINEMPHISTPDNLTNQNMWAFFFTEIQKIHTEQLNPVRLRVYAGDSNSLLVYRSVLKTLTQMFASFLYNDFKSEKKIIDDLFNQFQKCFNEANKLKKSVPNIKYAVDDLNDLYGKALKSLELIDNMLEVIRQKKGFGVTEQVSFVINERCEKALTINNNISRDIIKLFKRKGKKRKRKEVDSITDNAKMLLNEGF